MSDVLSRLASSAVGGMLGRGVGGDIGGAVLGAVLAHPMNNRTGAGGLSDLVDRFLGAGLGGHADSSVSHRPNQPIAPIELERVFEPGQLDAWSQQTGVNTPPAKAGGFSGELGGNPLAWRPKAGSRPEVRPVQHDPRGRHVAVEDAAASAAVLPLGERLGRDRAARGAGLGGPARVEQHDDATGPCCLVADVLNDLVPRGVVHGLGKHPARQPGDVQVLEGEVREAVHQRPRQFVREIAPLRRNAGVQPGDA